MALDLSKIINQITGMVNSLKAHRDEKRQQLQHAVAILHSQSNNLEQLAKKIEASKPTWLVARLVVAGLWSICSGILVLGLVLSLESGFA